MEVIMSEPKEKEKSAEVPEDIESRFSDMVKSQIEEAMASLGTVPKETLKETPDPSEEVRNALNPFIQPGIDDAKFRGDDAKDYASFYMRHPEALANQEEVEKMFTSLAQAGRGTTREDINRYIQGKKYLDNPTAFIDSEMERRKKELEALESSTDMAANGIARNAKVVSSEDFGKLSIEEMEKEMEGYTF